MKAVIQRVSEARVTVDEESISSIGIGLLVFLGVAEGDVKEDMDWLVRKIINMRIFSDSKGNMNLSLMDNSADIMVVSQFTLLAKTKKGNRPSFIKAAKPDVAISMYENFILALENTIDRKVARGVFAADMKVSLINDGPVTILLDSKNKE